MSPSRKSLARSLAVGAALAVGATGLAVPAHAAEEASSNATAYASGWEARRGEFGVALELDLLGGLLGLDRLLNSILNPILRPVTELLNAVPTAIVDPVLGLVAGDGLEARTPPLTATPSDAPFALEEGNSPAVGSPASCTETSGTCFSSAVVGLGPVLNLVDLKPLVGLDTGVIHGLTEPVHTGVAEQLVSQAQVAGIGLHLIGLDLLSVDAIESQAVCTVVGSDAPTAEVSVTGLNLLNGLVGVGIASDTGLLDVDVAGIGLEVGATLPVDLPGASVGLSADGSLLHLEVGVGVEELLTRLPGGGELWSLLNTLAVEETSATIVLEVASGTDLTDTSAAAHGLRVGVGLHLGIEVDLLGLAGARIATTQTPGTADNLLRLDLATASCAATATPGAGDSWISPGLT